MSSVDFGIAKVHIRSQYNHHRHHTMATTTNDIPTYVNRSVPTYSITTQGPVSQADNLASPRYHPNVQPWRKQQAQSSLSFVPSTSPRSEQSEYTTSQSKRPGDRGPACISPFRSVRRMKEPFQLRLPTSPSSENNSTFPKEPRVSPRPAENRTLRAWRSDQNLMSSSLETFGLLPSPPLSDFRASQVSPSSTYFSPKLGSDIGNEQEEAKECTCVPPQAKLCGICNPHALTNEVTGQNNSVRTTNVHMAHSNLIRQYESDDGQFTPASTDSEYMSSPIAYSDIDSVGKRNFSGSSVGTQRSRSGTVSSEGSWVPSSLSYCETWLQGAPLDTADDKGGRSSGFNRRRCQIVQKSPLLPDWKRSTNDVMFAVASKTKPKLVDISRQSSPAMSYSLPTPTHVIPSTPDQPLPEISAFSPDTPLEMSDSGYATHSSSYSAEGNAGGKEEDETDSSSLASGSMNVPLICDKPAPRNERPKAPPNSHPIPRGIVSPKIQAPSGGSSNKSEQEELEKWWDHEWTIDQLEHSVKDFPQNMLRLTSPVIMFLRHNHEKALMRPFRQIFPEASEPLLDSLCAVLIARNYIVSLPSLSRRTINLPPRSQFSRLDTVPEKASSILGMKFSQPSPSRIRDRVLGSRSDELSRNLDRIVDNLLFTICGPSNETLKSAVLVLIQVLETKA